MKKFFLCLISFLVITTASVGSGFLLSACDYSYSEHSGGGISEDENLNEGNNENDGELGDGNSEEDNFDDNTDENDNSDGNLDEDNSDEDASAQDISFSVQVRAYLSDGTIAYSSTLNSEEIYVGRFSISWHEGDGGWGNGDDKTWGNNNVPTTTAAYGYSVSGGGGDDTYASNLVYFRYSYSVGVQRYAYIEATTAGRFTLWGISTGFSFPTTQDSDSTKYIYGSGNTSNSEPSGTGTTMLGTWYINIRQRITINYNANGGNSDPPSNSFYAGLDATLSSTTPTRVGYTFNGWLINGKLYEAGDTVDWEDLEGDSTTITAVAQWIPEELSGYWTDSGNYDTSWTGSGTESSPYLISTERELAGLAYSVNNGTNYSGIYFKQTANLDMSAHWWDAIGEYTSSSNYDEFAGHYDGGGCTISGLYTEMGSSTSYSYQGLFGYVQGTSSDYAEIKNVGVINSNIQGYNYVGAIAGDVNYVNITNCYNTGSVSGHNYYVGGVVAAFDHTNITNCYNIGSVTGSLYVGGIVGCNSVGSRNCLISNCYNIGNVTVYGTYVGGIVGYIYNTNILNCYNTGDILGQNNYVGGIAGTLEDDDVIINCYNIGSVIGNSNVGGVVGYKSSSSTVSNCYYGGDCTLSYGVGSSSNTGTTKITSLDTTSYAKSESWHTNSSNWNSSYPWDFDSVWGISSYYNDGYPYLLGINNNIPTDTSEFWTDSGNYDTSWSGSGTESSPYLISTEEELAGLAYSVNNGTTYSGSYFKQTADLDMSEFWWKPIGNSSNRFSGNYDGAGHAISGLNTPLISSSTYSYQGLFGYVYGTSSNYVEIKNIGVINSNIQGYQYIGGIAGYSYYTNISVCYNTSEVIGINSYVGGIVGYSYYTNITNCYNTGSTSVQSSLGQNSYLGGIVGRGNYTTITNCYNTGSISSQSFYVGGIVGTIYYSTSSISNSYNTGRVSGSRTCGGIIGYNPSSITVSNCYYGGDCTLNYGIGITSSNTGTTKITSLNTTSYAKSESWYTNSSNWDENYPWDFDTVWFINSNYNDGYPIFIWQLPIYTITLNKQSGSGGPNEIYFRIYDGYYSDSEATTSISSVEVPTRTGYTFRGYYTGTNGSGSLVINSSGSISIIVDDTYFQGDSTLYAYWQINTYSLEINYSSDVGVTNSTDINITASSCTVSDSTISSGESSTISHTYSTSSYSIVIKLSNSSSYDYYMRIGSKPTATIYTLIYDDANDSYTYTWTPDSNDSITIYIYQRYTITYNGNNNTGGTVPSTQYKIFGTTLTLSANNLTRTGYTTTGWNTNSSGTGTHYDGSASYTVNASATLYSEWKANVYEVTLKYNNGNSDTKLYLKYDSGWYTEESCTNMVTSITTPTKTGYTFNGFYVNDGGSGTQTINSSGTILASSNFITSDTTWYAHWTAKNLAQQDSNGSWYVEMGYFPQTKETSSSIISALNTARGAGNTTGNTYQIAGQTLQCYANGGNEYAYYNGNYYKVEPVRYILAGTYSSNYATESGSVTAVTEKIVFVSEWQTDWTSTDCLGKGYNDATIKTNISTFVSNSGLNTSYVNNKTYTITNFKTSTGAVSTSSVSANAILSSTGDISEVYGSDYSAEFSDLVKDILDTTLLYWTRDVGSNLNNAECITESGATGVQSKMSNILGARVTINVKTFACE